jgi:hypothetical protein
MVVKDPSIAGIVVTSVLALVGLGLRISAVTKNHYDDSVFGFLAKILGVAAHAAAPAAPTTTVDDSLMTERADRDALPPPPPERADR